MHMLFRECIGANKCNRTTEINSQTFKYVWKVWTVLAITIATSRSMCVYVICTLYNVQCTGRCVQANGL